MSTQMTLRIEDALAVFIDETVRAGEGSRADVVNRALRREMRRRAAEQDARIYAAEVDPEIESVSYAQWAAENAAAMSAELD